MSELQNLVNIREEANRPIPAPRIRVGTPYSCFKKKEKCSAINTVF